MTDTQCTPQFTRIKAIQSIIDTHLNSRGVEKDMISAQLAQHCVNTPEYQSFITRFSAVDYCTKELRELNSKKKSYTTTLDTLVPEHVETIVKKYHLTEPHHDNSDKLGFVRDQLTARLQEVTTSLLVITAKKASRTALEKEMTKWRQAYDKAAKSSYSAWKKASMESFEALRKQSKSVLEQLVKGSDSYKLQAELHNDVFVYLKGALASVPEPDCTYFGLRLQRDEISHKSIRPSKTKLAARDLIKRAVIRYTDAVHSNFCKRVGQICDSNVTGVKTKIPDTVLVSDFIGCTLGTPMPFDGFFKNELFVGLTKKETHCNSVIDCGAFADGDGKPFVSWVCAHVKATYPNEFASEVVMVIAGLLVDLVGRFAKCLAVALKNHSNLQTINVGLIHTLYESMFVIRGEDYSHVRKCIDGIWVTKSEDQHEVTL
jgi:hypothetical protein